MAQAMLSVRVDTADKNRFETFCNETGMNVSVAINMFIKAVLREQKLPFEVKADPFYSEEELVPNAATLEAIREIESEYEYMKTHPNEFKAYDDVDEMFKDIFADEA